jgi:hypothetical protein
MVCTEARDTHPHCSQAVDAKQAVGKRFCVDLSVFSGPDYEIATSIEIRVKFFAIKHTLIPTV